MTAPPDEVAPVAAATVIPVRDGPDGIEVLLLRRRGSGNFAGMWVFPGGRIDPGDTAGGDGAADGMTSARRAAAREAAEEAELDLDPDRLVPWSHWVPPPVRPVRFATWFFVAAPERFDVVVDGAEVLEHRWLTPVDARLARDTGLLPLAPPTYVTLHQLDDVDTAAGALRGPPAVERFSSVIAAGADPPTLLWHDDAGYDTGDGDAPGARHRLVMGEPVWSYLRSRAD